MTKPEIITIIFFLLIHAVTSNEVLFDNCDKSSFYSLLNNGDESNQNDMHTLIKSMHRNVVPYTSSKEDVWDALIDVDGVTINSELNVPLIYKNVNTSAYPYGTPETWNREHLWPKSRGVFDSGPDFSDLHHLKPADWNVNSARGSKLFAKCGVVNDISDCTSPAHVEAPDTEADRTIFLPPPSVRGDIARAIMYMSVRYDGSDEDTLDLKLTDCGLEDDAGLMGYKSQLLEWHEADPVDYNEIKRNDRICERWQGNRNPFVDFPELAKTYFGTPNTLNEGVGYDCNTTSSPIASPTYQGTPTASPATTTSPSDTCKGLSNGDVIFTGFRSHNPDIVVLTTLIDLPSGIELYVTDNAWTGYDFKYTEGIQKLVVPDGGIQQGSIFGLGDSSLNFYDQWQSTSGNFALSVNGDNMHLYCQSSTNTGNSPLFLSSLIYNGIGWSDTNQDPGAFTAATSALPSNTAVSLPLLANSYYNGIRNGKKTDILNDFSNPNKWQGSDDPAYDVLSKQTTFSMVSSSPSSGVGRINIFKIYVSIAVLFLISIMMC